MRIFSLFDDRARIFENTGSRVVVGRLKKGLVIDLDLSPDIHVSRPHAQFLEENGAVWVEDLGSVAGTYVDEKNIGARAKCRLVSGSMVRMGLTLMRVEMPGEDFGDNPGGPFGSMTPEGGEITHVCDAASTAFLQNKPATQSSKVYNLLCELPLQFASETKLEDLLQNVVTRLMGIIPGASHGAVLLLDRRNDHLVLKAHHPSGGPSVSLSIARQTIERKQALVWSCPMSSTQVRFNVSSSLYAPIIRKNEVLGVVSVDSVQPGATFTQSDLQLVVLVAQYAGLAIENHYLRDDLCRHRELTERLFCSRFPQTFRQQLLRQATAGTLVAGTRQSEISILAADIRGFTQLTARIGPRRMKDILDQYFPALIEAIHRHEGTVERFVGDAIFAVFGSPRDDENHPENAVRAALEMQEAVGGRNTLRSAAGLETCLIGVGLHCGEAVHGFIGNAEHMEFAVLGEPANFAGRYCNAAASAETLISPELYSRVFHLVECESVTIPTKHEGELPAFRLKNIRK